MNENQAGFRKARCTTDQIQKLVQMASDKMHAAKDGTTTMVTFFDFSRAYDKVWREGLLHKMIKMGLPYNFIKYARLFLSARETYVEINGTRSNKFFLNEGLPQGQPSPPCCFSFSSTISRSSLRKAPLQVYLRMTRPFGSKQERIRSDQLKACKITSME